jgi:ferredoxin
MSVRLTVDWTRCTAHGLCAELLPELIDLDDWGYPVVSVGPVPADLEPHAVAAREACPALAVRLDKVKPADRPTRGTATRP